MSVVWSLAVVAGMTVLGVGLLLAVAWLWRDRERDG